MYIERLVYFFVNERNYLVDLSLEKLDFQICSFEDCHLVQFESMNCILHHHHVDLPYLHTIEFIEGRTLSGDFQNIDVQTKRFNNTLIMRGMFEFEFEFEFKMRLNDCE